jgi:hypothetical protein
MSVQTRLWAGQSGARFLAGARVIYFFQQVQTGSVAHLIFYSICEALSSRIQRPGREGDRSPPSGTEVQSDWSWTCISTPSKCLNGVDRQNVFTLHAAKPAEGRCCIALVVVFMGAISLLYTKL